MPYDPELNKGEGAANYQRLLDAGFSQGDADTWRNETMKDMYLKGTKPEDMKKFWGREDPDFTKLDEQIKANVQSMPPEATLKMADNPMDALFAGFQHGAMGLATSKPSYSDQLDWSKAGWLSGVGYAMGQGVSDLPLLIAGGFGGGIAGGAAGGPIGGAAGMGAGGAAVPEAFRQVMMDHYFNDKSGPFTWQEFFTRASKIAMETGKAAVQGAAGMVVGGAVGGKVLQATGDAAIRQAALLAGESRDVADKLFLDSGNKMAAKFADVTTNALAATAVGAGLDGRVPGAQDFATGAIQALAFHGAGELVGATRRYVASDAARMVQRNLGDVYTRTALDPRAVGQMAAENVAVRSEVYAPTSADGTFHTPTLDSTALAEPPQFHQPVQEAGAGITPETDLNNRLAQWNAQRPLELKLQGDGEWEPHAYADGWNLSQTYADWTRFGRKMDPNEATMRRLPNGQLVPEPGHIADYMEEFGRRAGFKFLVGESQNAKFENENAPGGVPGPAAFAGGTKRRLVYMPDTSNELMHRWYGLGRYEVLYHEIGHALDGVFNDSKMPGELPGQVSGRGGVHLDPFRAINWLKNRENPTPEEQTEAATKAVAFKQEVTEASKRFRPQLWAENPAYNSTTPELMADAFATYMSNPTERKNMPLFTERYGEFLAPYIKIAEKALPVKTEGGWQHPPQEPFREPYGPGNPILPPGFGGGTGGGGGGRVPPGTPRPEPTPNPTDWRVAKEKFRDFQAQQVPMSLWDKWLNPRVWRAAFQQQMAPARRLDLEFETKDFDKAGVEGWFRQGYASSGRAMTVFDTGIPERVGDNVNIDRTYSFQKAYDIVKAKGGNVEDFYQYIAAHRVLDLAERGINAAGKHLSIEDAMGRLTEPGIEAKYQEANKVYQEAKNGALRYVRDSGVWSTPMLDKAVELGEHHIYFGRVVDKSYEVPSPGRSFVPKQFSKKIEGGEDAGKVRDFVTADMANLHYAFAMADRNWARKKLLDFFNAGAVEKDAVPLGKEYQLTEVKAPWLDRDGIMHGQILDENDQPISEGAAQAAYPFLVEKVARANAKGNQFVIFIDGQARLFQSEHPDVLELMHMTFEPSQTHIAVKALQKFASMERAGISTRPIFALRSLFHQQFAGAVLGEMTPYPWANFFKGIASVWDHDEHYEQALASGALGTSMVHLDDNFIKRKVNDMFDATDTWGSVANIAKHPIDAWRSFQILLHEASGVGAFRRGKEMGLSDMEAATKTRTEYLDHAEPMSASLMQSFVRTVPFMSVGIKDVGQLMRAMHDRPLSTMTKGFMWITMPTILNYAVNRMMDQWQPEGQKYEDLPEWRRMLFLNIPTGLGFRIPVPRPYAVGYVFGAVPEMLLREFWGQDKHGMDHWAKNMVTQFVPPFIPALATPLIEQYANKDFVTDRPLVPQHLEKASGYMHYGPNISGTAKELSKFLGEPGLNLADVQPEIVDNYARKLFGPAGMAVMNILGAPFKDPGGPAQWADNPLVGSFITREGGTNSQVFSDLYNKMDEFDRAHADLRLAKEQVMAGADPNLMGQVGSNVQTVFRHEQIRTNLRQIMAEIHAVRTNPEMSDEEKIKWGDQLTQAAVMFAKQQLTLLDSF